MSRGGQNRLSRRQHEVAGTLRPDRHEALPDVGSGTADRLGRLRVVFNDHCARWDDLSDRLSEVLAADAKATSSEARWLTRELRAQASVITRLAAELDKYERLVEGAAEPSDGFAEFDAPGREH